MGRSSYYCRRIAIPLATTDLSCGRIVEDLASPCYAREEMTTHDALGSDPATSQARNAVWRFLDLARGFDPERAGLVQPEKFVESHGCKPGDFSSCGQESNSTTRHLAIMNLAIRGIEADFGPEHADTFRRDLLTAHSRN